MTFEEMKVQYEATMQEYESMRNDYTNRMRNILIEYNNDDIMYVSTNQTIKLNEASIEQIKCIISEIIMRNNNQVRAQQQSKYRYVHTEPNKYGPENEYGK